MSAATHAASLPINIAGREVIKSSSSGRLVSLDVARLFAALGVVWIHACQAPSMVPLAAYGRFAVPFFAATAAYLTVRSLVSRPTNRFREFATSRLCRLYIPFAVWSAAYVAFKLLKSFLLPNQPNDFNWLSIIAFGGAYHLWFIPFLLIASFALYAHTFLVGPTPQHQCHAAFGCFTLGGVIALATSAIEMPDHELAFMLQATPGLLWGAAFAWIEQSRSTKHDHAATHGFTHRSHWLLTGLIVFATCQALMPGLTRAPALENSAGFALLIVALSVPVTVRLAGLEKVGQLSLGIYFSHLLFIKVAEALFNKLAIASDLTQTCLLMLVGTTAGIVCSWTLSRYRLTKSLVT